TVAPSRALTRADGTARARWILGPRVDSAQTVLARVPGFEPAAFVAHAVTRGAPLQLAKRGGDGQRGPAGGVLADSLSVVLRMPDGRPVPGATVTWSAPADAGVVLPAVSRTDADGVASAAWRLGTRPGLAQAAAAVDEGTLLFTAGIESAAPVRVEAVGGSTEGPVGAPLADSLAVRVADTFGNPVAGVEVAWTRDWGGGAVTPAQGRTDAAGVARAQWTLGPFAGPPGQAASATVQGLPPVRFRATATTRGVPLQLVRVGGDAQVAEVGTMLPDSLAVRLLTQAGAPVQGAAIAWAVVTGGGRVSPATSRTDPQGFARAAWTLGTRVRNARASATLDDAALTFTAVPRPGPAATVHAHRGNGQSATRGTILDDSLVARVTDVYGNAVRGVKVRWMVTAGGGLLEDDTSVTPPNGLVRTRWALGVAPGENAVAAVVDGAAEGRFTATALPGTLTLRAWRHSGQHWRISATRHDLRAYVEAAVTDAGGRRAVTALVTLDDNHGQPLPWGPPLLRFLPRPPATLTATFNPMEMPLPHAVARFEDQRVEVVGVPVWDFYDLRLSVVPTAPKYYANDTVHVDLRMTYRFPADAPPGWEPVAPVRFESGGWVAESDTRAGADWPLGPELGSRRIYACVMMGGATCTSTFVNVVPRP
ncbi:MAG TPA: Ig-like domain-containing protein, partial [Longimicrobium sp.]